MLYTYDPKLLITVIGSRAITGFADGTFAEISRNADSFIPYSGTNGERSRAKVADKSGTLKLTLTQTSPDNDYLAALAALDESPLNAGVRSFLCKDILGTSFYSAPQCYIIKPADASYGKEIGTRVWTFDLVDLIVYNVGGNIPTL